MRCRTLDSQRDTIFAFFASRDTPAHTEEHLLLPGVFSFPHQRPADLEHQLLTCFTQLPEYPNHLIFGSGPLDRFFFHFPDSTTSRTQAGKTKKEGVCARREAVAGICPGRRGDILFY